MKHPKNLDYDLLALKIKEVIYSHTDAEGISDFSITQISPSAYFNREYAQAFLQWLISNNIAKTAFETGNSNHFKIKVTDSFLSDETNQKLFR